MLQAGFPGQAGGRAIAEVLFGYDTRTPNLFLVLLPFCASACVQEVAERDENLTSSRVDKPR